MFPSPENVKAWLSERGGSKSSSMLGVPYNTSYSVDAADGPPRITVKQKSVSPPRTPPSPPAIHTRTSSFDLHTIEPPSPTATTTRRSLSEQPGFDSDTTPLVEHVDPKQHLSPLHRKGAIKRASTKSQQQDLSNSFGKGNKKLGTVSKAISRSSTDLRELGDKPHKSQKKPPAGKRSGYWVSMMDGFQRILLFTPQYSVVKNCEKANRLNFDALEVNFTLKSVSVTLIDNNTNREVLLLSILP